MSFFEKSYVPTRAYLVFLFVSSLIGAMRRSSRQEENVPQQDIESEEGRRLPSTSSLNVFGQKDIRRKKSVRFCGKFIFVNLFYFLYEYRLFI